MPNIPFEYLLKNKYPFGAPTMQHAYAAVIDPVSCQKIFDLMSDRTEHYAMLRGHNQQMGCERVVPYIFYFVQNEDDPIFSLLRESIGREHGIVVKFEGNTEYSFYKLVKHCNKIPYVRMPDGVLAYLRYYDPHILRNYLEIVYPQQLYHLWGDSIVEIFAEDVEERSLKRFKRPAFQKKDCIPALQPNQVEHLLTAQYKKFAWILYSDIIQKFYPDISKDLSAEYKYNIYSLLDIGEQNGILSRCGLYEFVSLCAEKNSLHQVSFIKKLLDESTGSESQKLTDFSRAIHGMTISPSDNV